MTMQAAIRLFNNYLHSNHKQRTIDSYVHLLGRFERIYDQRELDSVGRNEIYTFLETLTQDLAKSTRRLRYAQLKAFYNFIIDRCSLNMRNPCNTSLLRKAYNAKTDVAQNARTGNGG
jgi:site-specific recombinase XerD